MLVALRSPLARSATQAPGIQSGVSPARASWHADPSGCHRGCSGIRRPGRAAISPRRRRGGCSLPFLCWPPPPCKAQAPRALLQDVFHANPKAFFGTTFFFSVGGQFPAVALFETGRGPHFKRPAWPGPARAFEFLCCGPPNAGL